jgi:hypothetical protein
MLGSGPGGAPLAPQFPGPLDPQPTPPPPPGNPPLRPAPIPSWASPPLPKSVEAAQKAYNELIKDIERHNSWRPDPNNWGAVQDYNQEAWYYNSLKAQLESQLDSSNVKYAPASQAVRMDIPSWTQPAPESLHPAPANHDPGTWEPVNESMSPRAAAYQTQITGHPFTDGYIVNGVKFDGFENGVLIDAKGYYSQFIVDGEWQPWFSGQQALINQALAQVRAAGGTPIRWVFAEPETAALVEQLFAGDPRLSGIIINVVFPK